MDLKEIYWAAGFLEGEGYPAFHNTTQFTACQKQDEPLRRLQRLFGGRVYWLENKSGGIFHWSVNGARARGVMMTLFSSMSIRRKGQISKALMRWKMRPSHRGSYYKGTSISDSMIRSMLKRHRNGVSARQIATEYALPLRTIHMWIANNGRIGRYKAHGSANSGAEEVTVLH